MKTSQRCVLWLTLLIGCGIPQRVCAAPASQRIWILPLDVADGGDPNAIKAGQVVAELLAVYFSEAATVVEREHLERVLVEQKLDRDGLTSAGTRARLGRLLGATVIISGTTFERGDDLQVIVHATDVESSRVVASHEVRGRATAVRDSARELYRGLARELGKRLPELRPEQIDKAPVPNLFFLQALDDYYAGRYADALAGFLRASEEASLRERARLWVASCFVALEEYGHAYLELRRLALEPASGISPEALEGKLSRVRRELEPSVLELYDAMLGAEDKEPSPGAQR